MNYSLATLAVQAAVEESKRLNAKMNIAIVDVGANLVYFVRMDKSYLGSVDISDSLHQLTISCPINLSIVTA